jgi:hypothetical protein
VARPVLHHQDAYVLWSTVVDAPLTTGVTRQEMVRELLDRGDRSMPLVLEAIEMATAYGTSFVDDDGPEKDLSALDVISGNRAGANESCIEPEELLRLLFVERAPLERIRTIVGTLPQEELP